MFIPKEEIPVGGKIRFQIDVGSRFVGNFKGYTLPREGCVGSEMCMQVDHCAVLNEHEEEENIEDGRHFCLVNVRLVELLMPTDGSGDDQMWG